AVAACSSAPGTEHGRGTVLRVGTKTGLETIQPGAMSGPSASFADLVYPEARQAFSSISQTGRTLELVPAADPKLPLDSLLPATRAAFPDAHLVGGRIVATLPDGAATPSLDDHAFAVGPFVQTDFTSERQILRRQSSGGIEQIELVALGHEEAVWRGFL